MKSVLPAFLLILIGQTIAFGCTEVINELKVKAIYGRVFLTAQNRKEILPNATIKIRKLIKETEDGEEFETVAEMKTDKDGRFDFKGIPSGTYNILVESEYTKRFWGWVKLKASSSAKAKNKEILIYVGLPMNCENYSELKKVSK